MKTNLVGGNTAIDLADSAKDLSKSEKVAIFEGSRSNKPKARLPRDFNNQPQNIGSATSKTKLTVTDSVILNNVLAFSTNILQSNTTTIFSDDADNQSGSLSCASGQIRRGWSSATKYEQNSFTFQRRYDVEACVDPDDNEVSIPPNLGIFPNNLPNVSYSSPDSNLVPVYATFDPPNNQTVSSAGRPTVSASSASNIALAAVIGALIAGRRLNNL